MDLKGKRCTAIYRRFIYSKTCYYHMTFALRSPVLLTLNGNVNSFEDLRNCHGESGGCVCEDKRCVPSVIDR